MRTFIKRAYESWTARVLVRGGDPEEPLLYHINDTSDRERLLDHYLPGPTEVEERGNHTRFFVFDAGDRTVAVSMEHVIFWQNCYNSSDLPFSHSRSDEEEGFIGVNVYLAGVREPMYFLVAPDDVTSEGDKGEFRNLLATIDGSGAEKDSYISFTDEDGEEAYFRAGDITILEVAKFVTGSDDATQPGPTEPAEPKEKIQ